MNETFDVTLTLRAGYGEPPTDAVVIVGGEIWQCFEGAWYFDYEWGRESRTPSPHTRWVELPQPVLPPPYEAWVEFRGQRWASARGIIVTPEAPAVSLGAAGWRALKPEDMPTLAALLPNAPGKPYPLDRRFNPHYAPVLEAGDAHTIVTVSPNAAAPACAVWRRGRLIAIIMPMDATDTVSPTLGEILQSRTSKETP